MARIWYPEDRGPLLEMASGYSAEVLNGDPAYQVSSGEIIAL